MFPVSDLEPTNAYTPQIERDGWTAPPLDRKHVKHVCLNRITDV